MTGTLTRKYKDRNGRKFLILVVSPVQVGSVVGISFVASNENMTQQIFNVSFPMDIFTKNQLYPHLNNTPIDDFLFKLGVKIVKEKIVNNDLETRVLLSEELIKFAKDNPVVNSQEEIFISNLRVQQDILACLYEKTKSVATLKEIADYVWCDKELLSNELVYLDAEGFISCPPLENWNGDGEIVMSTKGKAKYEEIMKNDLLKRVDNQNQSAGVTKSSTLELDDKLPILKSSYIKNNFQTMIDLSIKNAEPIALIMIDIDHFKNFNSNYGLLTGDDVLIATAGKIKSVVGDKGKVIRFGGEEISVILPNYSIDEAKCLAERIRQEIEEYPFKVKKQDKNEIVQIKVSLGVTGTSLATDYKTLIEEADSALRLSKANGRNRVTVFNGGQVEVKNIENQDATSERLSDVEQAILRMYVSRDEKELFEADFYSLPFNKVEIGLGIDDLCEKDMMVQSRVNMGHGAGFSLTSEGKRRALKLQKK